MADGVPGPPAGPAAREADGTTPGSPRRSLAGWLRALRERGLPKAVRVAGGIGLLVPGVIFTLFPLLPGLPLILAGLLLLARDVPMVRRLIQRAKDRRRRRGPAPVPTGDEAAGGERRRS